MRQIVLGIALFAVLATGAVAAVVKGGSYTGTSTESIAVTFKVSASGKAVKSFKTQLGYDGFCGQGGGPGYTVSVASMAIKHGKFSKTVSAKGPVSSVPSIKVKITGTFAGKIAAGKLAKVGAHCTGANKTKNPYQANFTATAK